MFVKLNLDWLIPFLVIFTQVHWIQYVIGSITHQINESVNLLHLIFWMQSWSLVEEFKFPNLSRPLFGSIEIEVLWRNNLKTPSVVQRCLLVDEDEMSVNPLSFSTKSHVCHHALLESDWIKNHTSVCHLHVWTHMSIHTWSSLFHNHYVLLLQPTQL